MIQSDLSSCFDSVKNTNQGSNLTQGIKACFVSRVTHKFRSEFGKSHLIRAKEKILVAFSGGLSSSALLHLVEEGMSKKVLKKLRFCPSFLYVDDGFSLSLAERLANMEMVARKLHSTELPYFIYHLNQQHDSCSLMLANDRTDATFDLESALNEMAKHTTAACTLLMDSVKTETSKKSLIHLLRNQALANVARMLGIEKVIVGDIANSLAVRIISCVAQGRGNQLPCEMSFADDRHGDVTFVRPMRDFTARELEIYLELHDVESLKLHVSLEKDGDVPSIESLSRDFVYMLQSSHDNTVPIICRTAGKLVIPQESALTNHNRCSVCKAIIDNSLPSTILSSFNVFPQSLNNVHPCAADQPLVGDKPNKCQSAEAEAVNAAPSHRSSVDEVPYQLCYGCRRIAQDMVTAPPGFYCFSNK